MVRKLRIKETNKENLGQMKRLFNFSGKFSFTCVSFVFYKRCLHVMNFEGNSSAMMVQI